MTKQNGGELLVLLRSRAWYHSRNRHWRESDPA